jgi:signal transduction histidine kinase
MCWIGTDIVEDEIERRLVHDAVSNVAGMLKEMRLTPSSGVVKRLGHIVDAHLVVVDENGQLIGTSMSSVTDADLKRLRGVGKSEATRFEMGGESYAVGVSELTLPNGKHATILLLKPTAIIDAARTRTTKRLLVGAGAALGVATLLILFLSVGVTRPLRKLTAELDAASMRVTDEGAAALQKFKPPRSSSDETDRLAQAFARLVEELSKAEERMTRLEQLAAIGKVTASVVHEIRNPLSGMKMHLRLLEDESGITADGLENVGIIADELGRLELYVDELVVLAKSGKAASDIPAEAVDLKEEVSYMVKLFQRKAEHAELSVVQDVADDLPAVSTAKPRLRQLIMNLFLNAIEACEPGATITFTGKMMDDGTVELIVADEGKGVGTVDGDIFDAFVSGKAHGGGLGLYVCRQIVTSYGGDIRLLDRDKGAAFQVILNSFDTGKE